ncbi:hypothetical protein KC319_g18688, partial [Hortaea werneckii]
MAEEKPIQSEQDNSAPLAKSLDERLTFPDSKRSDNDNNTSAPSKFSWSDEMETPTVEKKSELENAQSDGAAEAPVGEAQKDGATTWLNGSEGLDEPEFDVNVKLADLQ